MSISGKAARSRRRFLVSRLQDAHGRGLDRGGVDEGLLPTLVLTMTLNWRSDLEAGAKWVEAAGWNLEFVGGYEGSFNHEMGLANGQEMNGRIHNLGPIRLLAVCTSNLTATSTVRCKHFASITSELQIQTGQGKTSRAGGS